MKRGALNSSSTPLKRRQIEETIELPEELWLAIFPHLPLNNFTNIAQVNKQSLHLIQLLSQQCIQSYFSSAKTEPDFKDNALKLLTSEYKRYQRLFPTIPFHAIFTALKGELYPLQKILSSPSVSSLDKGCLLQYAVKNGHLILANLLLADCPHPHSAHLWPYQKVDAVLAAARYGHYNIVYALLSTGRAFSDHTKLQVLSFAIQDKHEDAVSFILNNSLGFSDFFIGARLKEYPQNDQEEYVKVLLKEAVGSSAENDGWLLKYAAKNNQLTTVKACLEKATQITNDDKGLALVTATTQGHLDIVKILLECTTISNDYKEMAILGAKSKHYDKIATEIESHLELSPPALTFAFKQPSSSSPSLSSSESSEENTEHNEKSSSFSCS